MMTQEESPFSDSHLCMIVHCTFSKHEQKTKNVFDNLVVLETRPEKKMGKQQWQQQKHNSKKLKL